MVKKEKKGTIGKTPKVGGVKKHTPMKKPLKEVKAPPVESEFSIEIPIYTFTCRNPKSHNETHIFYSVQKEIPNCIENITDWISVGYLEQEKNRIKAELTKYLIRSIILSLGLGYALSFITN